MAAPVTDTMQQQGSQCSQGSHESLTNDNVSGTGSQQIFDHQVNVSQETSNTVDSNAVQQFQVDEQPHRHVDITLLKRYNVISIEKETELTQEAHFKAAPTNVQLLVKCYPNPVDFLKAHQLSSVLDLWQKAFRDSPDVVCCTGYGDRNDFTYKEIDQKSSALAASFQSRIASGHVRPNGRVLVALPSSPEFIISVLGAQKAGLVPVNIVVGLNKNEFQTRLYNAVTQTQPDIIIGSKIKPIHDAIVCVKNQLIAHEREGTLSEQMASMTLADNPTKFSPTEMPLYFSGLWGAMEHRGSHALKSTLGKLIFQIAPRTPDSLSFHDAVNSKQTHSPLDGLGFEQQLKKDALILFTSGTTGVGKVAVYTHEMCLITAIQVGVFFEAENQNLPKNPSLLFPLPTGHAFGSLVSMFQTPIFDGTIHLVLNPRETKYLTDALKKAEHADIIFGVDKMYQKMLSEYAPALEKTYLGNPASAVVTGASATAQATKESAEAIYGTAVTDGFGSTETVIAFAASVKTDPYGGLVPLAWNRARFIDFKKVNQITEGFDLEEFKATMDTQIEGEFNTEGVLFATGNIITEYLHNKDATSEAFIKDKNGTLWYNTGDLARVNQKGTFIIVARVKETIIIHGANYSPDEIQSTLDGAPNVTEKLIFRFPRELDNQGGSDHVILLVKGDNISKESVIDHMQKHHVPGAACPRAEHIIILPSSTAIPSTGMLKPQRVQLTAAAVANATEAMAGSTDRKPSADIIVKAVLKALKDGV